MTTVELSSEAVYAEGVIMSSMKFHAFYSAKKTVPSRSRGYQRVTAEVWRKVLKFESFV